jgi:hypothetical protein
MAAAPPLLLSVSTGAPAPVFVATGAPVFDRHGGRWRTVLSPAGALPAAGTARLSAGEFSHTFQYGPARLGAPPWAQLNPGADPAVVLVNGAPAPGGGWRAAAVVVCLSDEARAAAARPTPRDALRAI